MKNLSSFIRRHRIGVFFIATLGLTWLAFLPYMQDPENGIPWFTFGPAAAALLTASLAGGRRELGALLASVVRWKVSPRWYLVALGLPFLAQLGSILLNPLLGSAAPNWAAVPPLTEIIPMVALFLVFSGPLGEEIGWRGYALPLLLERYSALYASLILGGIWAIWHLPLILVGDFSDYSAVMTVIAAIVITWVFQNSRGSVLIAILMHASNQNSARFLGQVFTDADKVQQQWIAAGIWVFAVAAILLACGTQRFVMRGADRAVPAL